MKIATPIKKPVDVYINNLQKYIYLGKYTHDFDISLCHIKKEFTLHEMVRIKTPVGSTIRKEIKHQTNDVNILFNHKIFTDDVILKNHIISTLEKIKITDITDITWDVYGFNITLTCSISHNNTITYYLEKTIGETRTIIYKSNDVYDTIKSYNIYINKYVEEHNNKIDKGFDFIERIIYNNLLNIDNDDIDIFYHKVLSKYIGNIDEIDNITDKVVYLNDKPLYILISAIPDTIFITSEFEDILKYDDFIYSSYIIGYIKKKITNFRKLDDDFLDKLESRFPILYLK